MPIQTRCKRKRRVSGGRHKWPLLQTAGHALLPFGHRQRVAGVTPAPYPFSPLPLPMPGSHLQGRPRFRCPSAPAVCLVGGPGNWLPGSRRDKRDGTLFGAGEDELLLERLAMPIQTRCKRKRRVSGGRHKWPLLQTAGHALLPFGHRQRVAGVTPAPYLSITAANAGLALAGPAPVSMSVGPGRVPGGWPWQLVARVPKGQAGWHVIWSRGGRTHFRALGDADSDPMQTQKASFRGTA